MESFGFCLCALDVELRRRWHRRERYGRGSVRSGGRIKREMPTTEAVVSLIGECHPSLVYALVPHSSLPGLVNIVIFLRLSTRLFFTDLPLLPVFYSPRKAYPSPFVATGESNGRPPSQLIKKVRVARAINILKDD